MNAATRIAIVIVAMSAWIAQAGTPRYASGEGTETAVSRSGDMVVVPRFASDRLERIAAIVGINDSGAVELQGVGRVPLRVDSDSVTGVITHIGVRVFSDRQHQMAPSPVYDFLERYTLESLLPGERQKPLEKQLVEDDLEFAELDLPGIARMSLDTVEQPATVTCLGGRRYRVEWPYSKGRSRAVDFPINHRLLLGQDMDELERRLITRLTNVCAALGGPALDGHSEDAILDQLLTINPQASVTMLAYGGNKILEVSLLALFKVMKAEGCAPAVSALPSDNDNIIKLLILENHPSLGYCHSVRIEADKTILDTGQGTVKARLAPYLPMSKVENLFYENQLAE